MSVIGVSALPKPGPPLPSATRRYDSGGFLSARRTLPSKVPFTAATPIFSVALNSSGPSASSFSQPGIALRSCLGSRNASQTFARGAATSYEPSSFIPFSFEAPRLSDGSSSAGSAGATSPGGGLGGGRRGPLRRSLTQLADPGAHARRPSARQPAAGAHPQAAEGSG